MSTMPRSARVKSETGIYHIMVRSISETNLFKDSEDKDRYLMLIRKYQKVFLFKVYAYCLMTTHGHIMIDCCGADISKVMKSINQSYVIYYNKKYQRHGHLFQDRFKSKLVGSDRYLIVLSAYIHNNPKDINELKGNIQNYLYSSLGVYLGLIKDRFSILNTEYVLSHFSNNKSRAIQSYLEVINRVYLTSTDIDIEFSNDCSETRNERKILVRNFTSQDVINFISKYTGLKFNIHIKFNHKNTELKSLYVLLIRSLCNFTFKDICNVIGNTSVSNLCSLYNKGYKLIIENSKYSSIIDDFILKYSV